MFTDSHCHLEPKPYGGAAGVDATVQRALDAGVTRMVAIGSGYGPDSIDRARQVAERHESVWFTAGLHPHHASQWGPIVAAHLRAAWPHPRCVAIGELGLDFHYDHSPRDQQRRCLREQTRLALDLGAPITIHDRQSSGETLAILQEEGAFEGAGVLFHCFSGTVDEMHQIVRQGGYISIPGIVTFRTAAEMQEVARQAPLDRLLIETDSPFLAPVPFRGKTNEPARVVHVAAKIALLRGQPIETIGRATTENAMRFYRTSSPCPP